MGICMEFPQKMHWNTQGSNVWGEKKHSVLYTITPLSKKNTINGTVRKNSVKRI